MRTLLTALSLALFFIPAPVQAQGELNLGPARGEIYSCGQAITGDINTNPGYSYCNSYMRQLAYQESADKLRRQLIERQQNFAEPSLRARREYVQAVKDMHASHYATPEEIEEAAALLEEAKEKQNTISASEE
jgi:hypothetical protein